MRLAKLWPEKQHSKTLLSLLCCSVAGYRGVFSLSILLHLLALLYTAVRFPLDTRTPDTG